ncbi:MAG: hypothetical protein PHP96_01810 [Candidatus Dojkabacteria bacterium]|nr:hypothetical protein [Candidatus Dojkabacteria bacterium]MDD4561251.1 hypothetical protein [Candidatus Dojkabacteria bacterium]
MAQQRKQYEGAIDSIFDFIFEQTEKPPYRRSPVKLTGVDGTSEVVEALAAMLEGPGKFVSDETFDVLQEFANIDLAKVSLGDRPPGAIKFNLKDLAKILKDPSAYVDSKFKTMEAIRKSQRITHSGEIMGSFVAKGWARRSGLGKDVEDAVMAMGRPQAFKDKMMDRNRRLIEKHFGPRATSSLSRNELVRRYGAAKGGKYYDAYDNARRAWNVINSRTSTPEQIRVSQDELLGYIENKDFYAILESNEIRKQALTTTDREQQLGYIRAARYVDNMALIDGNPLLEKNRRAKFREDSKQSIKAKERMIDNLKRAGAPAADIEEQKRMIKAIKSDLRNARNYEFLGTFGEWEGRYNSTKAMFVEGNLVPYLINGKFFDSAYNQTKWLQPATEGKLYAGKNRKGKETEIKLKVGKQTGNKFLDSYNEGMMAFYYASPVTWAKTLATGEGFAYMAYLSSNKISKILGSTTFAGGAAFNVKDFLKDIAEGNATPHLTRLRGLIGRDEFEKIEKLASRLGRQSKLSYRFSSISRVKDKVQKFFDKHFGRKIRDFVGNKVLLKMKFLFNNSVAKTAIESWMKSGGLYSLIRTVISAALKAVGVSVAGPIGAAVAELLTWVATNVVIKIAKPVLKVGVEFLKFGCIGCFGLTFFIVILIFPAVWGQQSHIAPGTCEECDEWGGYAKEYEYGPIECLACSGEAFEKVSDLPTYDSVPDIAKDYFESYISPKLTPELMEAYAAAEEATGVPCEIVAGIHHIEASNRPDGSLWNGGPLQGTLVEDAISAMEHFVGKINAIGGDVNNLDYQTLRVALAAYNGYGNANCNPYNSGTRWMNIGKCSTSLADYYLDHIYPVSWIDEDHLDMQVLYCLDGIQFSCNTEGPPPCHKGSPACSPALTENNFQKFPDFQKPGALTVAIILHELSTSGGCGGPEGPGGGYTCQGGETYESLLQANKDLWSNVADLSHVELILVDCPGDYAVCNKSDGAFTCWANNPIECQRGRMDALSCDGASALLCHELVHFIQRPLSASSLAAREWGADFACSNGGGYSFSGFGQTCVKANEVNLPASCRGVERDSALQLYVSGVDACINDLSQGLQICWK